MGFDFKVHEQYKNESIMNMNIYINRCFFFEVFIFYTVALVVPSTNENMPRNFFNRKLPHFLLSEDLRCVRKVSLHLRHHVFLDQFSGGFLWRVPKFSFHLCLYDSRIHITTELLLHIMRLLNIGDVLSILPKLLDLGSNLREY